MKYKWNELLRVFKYKWIDGHCRHLCFLCPHKNDCFVDVNA